jgi:class 3 adenylate cyclase/tetratricopeptide (TPR) repeat protein
VPACPQCGQENPDGFKFCGACGSRFAEVETEPAPEEERKVVTALFTDIVGSTASAEQMDPEDVWARLTPYYARLRAELESFGGTVEKFIGDAVVALFGAPVAHEDDPERAVRAALAITKAVAELNEQDEWLDLHVRTAVHTGEAYVIVGARASEGETLAAGDVMNTAARLQGGAPVDGVVVGEATFLATKDLFEFREAEPVKAKGKVEPIPIWEVVGEKAAPPRVAARTPLVGRTEELELLRGCWEQVRADRRPRLATVLGAPGIGKSRLLLALCEEAEREGSVHWGRCLPYGEGMTYWPIAEIVRSAAGIRHDDDRDETSAKLGSLLESLPTEDRDELRTIAASLAAVVGVPTTPRGTYTAVEISQAELHWGIRRLFQLLGEQRPLLLVFEDLHWAEPTLLELIRLLVDKSAEETPVLVIGSGRPELAEQNPAIVARGDRRAVLVLEALTGEDSAALVAELLGTDAPSGAAFDTLVANARGNPLFLEETIRMLSDLGALGAETDVESLPVPENLQTLIGSRLDALPPTEKRTAQHASVVGGVFWSGAVAHLTGSDGDLSGPLQDLQRRDIVEERRESTVAGDTEYDFKHILIRDVAYERLPKGRRADLHARFVDWMSRLGADDEFVEIVAYHLEQACLLARAVARAPIEPPVLDAIDALKRSAQKAERREGLREADRFYTRGLDLLDGQYPEASVELRLRRGATLVQLGELAEADRLLAGVADEARARGRLDLRCAALLELGDIDQRQGRAAEAREQLVEASQLAKSLGHPTLEIRAVFILAALRADFEGAYAEAIEDLQRAVVLAAELGDSALQAEGHLRIAALMINLGRFVDAEGELEGCLALAGEMGSHKLEAEATSWLGMVRFYRGRPEEANQLGLQAREWLERTGDSYFQVQNLVRGLSMYALARNHPEAAERWLREAIPTALDIGGWVVVETYRFLTEALVRQGRLRDARKLAEFAGRNLPEEDVYARAAVQIAEGIVKSAVGDAAAAVDRYEEALHLLIELKVPVEVAEARLAFGRALQQAGDEARAREQLTQAREAFGAMGADGMLAQIDRELGEVTVSR